MSDIEPINLSRIPLLPTTERPASASAAAVLRDYRVRRVPCRLVLNGEPASSIVHAQDREVVVADPGGPDVGIDRTELAERAFDAGAATMLEELLALGAVDLSRVASRPAPCSAASAGLARVPEGRRLTVRFSGCFQVRLNYPGYLDPRHQRPE